MGLSTDIQADLAEAYVGDLADVYQALTVTSYSSSVYNPTTGVPARTGTTRTVYGAVLDDKLNNIKNEPHRLRELEILILDQDKGSSDFNIGDKVTYSSSTFEIVEIMIDPVGATHTLKCEKWP